MGRMQGVTNANWGTSSLPPDSYLFPSVNSKAYELSAQVSHTQDRVAKIKPWGKYHIVNLVSVGTNLLSVVASAVMLAVDAVFRSHFIAQDEKPFTHSCQQLGRSLLGLPILFEMSLYWGCSYSLQKD